MNRTGVNPDSPTTSRREWLVALALIGAGVALRLWVAGRSAVEHFDEGVYASNLYFGEPQFTYPMQHLYAPPLLPSLIEAGMIAGLPPNVAAILPSLLAGCAMLVAVWRIGRRWFGPAAGLAALSLASLSDFHVAYSGTALTDVLLTLFVLLAVAATARALASAVGDGRDDGPSERLVDKKSGETRPVQPSAKRRGAKRPAREGPADPVSSPDPAISANLVDKWAVVAGLLTAAAWWTKYNGWLPLAIAIAGTGWLIVISPLARAKWQRMVFVLVLIGATAAIAWSPVPFGLSEVGGYASVAANHATYVVGPAGWLSGAARQIANQSAMEGLLSWLSVPVAVIVVWLAGRWNAGASERRANSTATYVAGWAMGLGIASVVESAFLVLLVVSSVTFAVQFVRLMRERDWKVTESQVGLCLLLAWFGGLLLATPNYWPYPRLVMPLLACLWLVGGNCFALLVGDRLIEEGSVAAGGGFVRQLRLGIVAGLVVLLPVAYIARSPIKDVGGSLGIDRTGMRDAALELTSLIARDLQSSGDGLGCVIFVQAEPALVFQLRAAGFPFVQPVIAPPGQATSFEGKSVPTYYVLGPHARRDSQFVEQWQQLEKGYLVLSPKGIDSRPSGIVRFDSADPRITSRQPEKLWLYRAK